MAAPSQPMAEHRMRDIRCNNKRSVPPSAWRHLQPKSRPPLRKEQKKKKKKHSHTREKSTCKPLRALRIKHTDLKVLLSRTFSPSFPPPRCSTGGSFALRRSPTELLAWFNASCSGAKKHGIYVLAPLSCFFFFFFFLRKSALRFGDLFFSSMDFLPTFSQTESPL